MRYLCRLITPPSGVVLDPFFGSGSTGVAAIAEGFSIIGIEQDAEFAEIARRFADAELAESSSATLPLPPQDEEARVLETVLDFEKTIERTLAGARRTTTV